MIIETKFEIDENAVLINNDRLITLPVKGIDYINGAIRYSFCSAKAATNLDSDKLIHRDEDECFKSIKQLAEHYESKQNR